MMLTLTSKPANPGSMVPTQTNNLPKKNDYAGEIR